MVTTESTAVDKRGPDWLSSIAAGTIAIVLVGVVIWAGFEAAIIEESIPEPFGLSGPVFGWLILVAIGVVLGIVYGALNAIEPIDRWASTARTGAILGLLYGLVLWAIAVMAVPLVLGEGTDAIGEYAVTTEGLLTFALLGVLIGFCYLLLPVLRAR